MTIVEAGSSAVRGLTHRWMPRAPEALETGGVAPLIERVLRVRGLTGEAGDAFITPSLKGLHDPGLLPDADRAAARILKAADEGERIVVFGDYDVDGVTAASILVHMLRVLRPDADVGTYIPHRVEEGYGLNEDAVRRLAEGGTRVLVTVDCGITGHEPALVARSLGLDLIITDHHNPPERMEDLPEAYAVVHPRRPDSGYPWGELCGAGVAYKLAWRMATMDAGGRVVSDACRSMLLELLGLAALGTIADVVPLLDENRVIARHGLTNIARSSNPGLQALIRASSLDSDKIDAEAVGFRLAPRLNAVGRLGHAREALELLTEATGERARELAEQLSGLNDERRSIERSIMDRACELAESAGMTSTDRRGIVLACEGWHPGVVGIVCSRLVEKYARPVVLLSREGEMCKGSGRSVDGFNLHGAFEACSAELERFGGHDMAAGLACRTDRFDAFADRFVEHCNEHLGVEDLVNTLRYDATGTVDELTVEQARTIERLAPFGAGNPKVRVRLRGRIAGTPKIFGSRGDHMSFQLVGESGRGVRVVGWKWSEHADRIPPGCRAELIVEPKVSTWNAQTRVEPILEDLRVLGERES